MNLEILLNPYILAYLAGLFGIFAVAALVVIVASTLGVWSVKSAYRKIAGCDK